MGERKKYMKKATASIVAVRVDLDTEGFTYKKWGETQRCKPGDWLVNNNGDVYTVDRDTFERTYREVSPGVYVKTTPVWADVADRDGRIRARETVTNFKAGDYLVFSDEDGEDGYAVSADSFEAMYESTS